MKFLIDKKTRQCKMRGFDKIQFNENKFEVVEITPTQSELKEIEQNSTIFVKNNKLELKKHSDIESKDKLNEIETLKKQLLEETTVKKITPILIKLFDLIQ